MSDTIVTAEYINALKSSIKSELKRRKGYGDLSVFADVQYDFTEAPMADKEILVEHGQKTIDLLLYIKDITGINKTAQGDILPPTGSTLATLVRQYASESMEGNTSSCRGACAGLCVGNCTGGCNGCTGKCDTGCQGCTASCGSGCANGCMYA